MSIKNLSLILFSAIALGAALLAVLLAVLTTMLVESGNTLFESTPARYQSYLLADELRQLEIERAEAKRRAARESVEAAAATASARAHRGGLAEELRDAASARRAIILREVLGTPVGLR